MIARLGHRGPDAMAVFVDGHEGGQHVGLAHSRLSIVDLENGRQPMCYGSLTITFNGEIYNHVELRETLIQKGHTFQTRSDTEVILHAYQEYGEECVEHFNGQWAFAIWDRSRQTLFLSRDRFGIRPLYYTQSSGKLLFASEIKSLFVHPEVCREIDPHGLSQLFTFWTTLTPRTIFREILELPPGHNLLVQGGKVGDASRYWHLDYHELSENASSNRLAEELRWLLEDATRLRLRADVPVGAYLSGGLDSSITAALAQEISGERLQTFSVTFSENEFDERKYQQQVASHLHVQHQSLDCSGDAIARVFPSVIGHAEKPMLRTAPAPLFLLSQLVQSTGIKVVLTGEGADELLGGYDIFKEAKVRRFAFQRPASKMPIALFRMLYPYLPAMQAQSTALRQAFFQVQPETYADPLFSHLPRWEMTGQLRRLLAPDFCPADQKQDLYEEVRQSLPKAFAGWSPFCQAQYLETTMLMPGYLLSSQGDRMAMAHSVESRYPFLDHRLAEFAARLPTRLKMKGLREKHLLKQATADLVPPAITDRTKQPYRAPDAQSFFSMDWQHSRFEYVDQLLTEKRLQEDGVFNARAATALLKKVRSGKAVGIRDNMAFVGMLSTQLLIDQMVRKSPETGTVESQEELRVESPELRVQS
jgi:asparagine synthase (glutamine-hydrolysing)